MATTLTLSDDDRAHSILAIDKVVNRILLQRKYPGHPRREYRTVIKKLIKKTSTMHIDSDQ